MSTSLYWKPVPPEPPREGGWGLPVKAILIDGLGHAFAKADPEVFDVMPGVLWIRSVVAETRKANGV